MKSTTLFRTVLLLNIGVIITGIIAGFMLIDSLPLELQSYLSALEEQDLTVNDLIVFLISIPALVLIIISTIGVYFFKRWARFIYVVITIILTLLTPIFGPTVMNGWETLFNDLALTLDGALIVMMFTGTTADKFSSKHDQLTSE